MAGILPRRRREKRENESLSIIWTVTAAQSRRKWHFQKVCIHANPLTRYSSQLGLTASKPPAFVRPQKIWIASVNGASQSFSFPLAASKEILFLASFCQLGPVSKHLLSGRGCHEIWGTTLLSLGEKKDASKLQRRASCNGTVELSPPKSSPIMHQRKITKSRGPPQIYETRDRSRDENK